MHCMFPFCGEDSKNGLRGQNASLQTRGMGTLNCSLSRMFEQRVPWIILSNGFQASPFGTVCNIVQQGWFRAWHIRFNNMVLEIWHDPEIAAETGYEYTRAIQFQCLGRLRSRRGVEPWRCPGDPFVSSTCQLVCPLFCSDMCRVGSIVPRFLNPCLEVYLHAHGMLKPAIAPICQGCSGLLMIISTLRRKNALVSQEPSFTPCAGVNVRNEAGGSWFAVLVFVWLGS